MFKKTYLNKLHSFQCSLVLYLTRLKILSEILRILSNFLNLILTFMYLFGSIKNEKDLSRHIQKEILYK